MIRGLLTPLCLLSMAPCALVAKPVDDFAICGLLCSEHDRRDLERQLRLHELSVASGRTVYRALAVDGWAHPMPAITFFRDRGGPPEVEIRWLSWTGRRRKLMTSGATISEADWAKITDLVTNLQSRLDRDRADRLLREKRGPNGEVGEIEVCADGWSYRLEVLSGGESRAIPGNCPDLTGAAYQTFQSIGRAATAHRYAPADRIVP